MEMPKYASRDKTQVARFRQKLALTRVIDAIGYTRSPSV